MQSTLDMAREMILENQAAQALPILHKQLQTDANDAAAHSLLGYAYAGVGEIEKGIAHAQRAIALEPEVLAYHIGLAEALLQANRAEESIRNLQGALKLDPQSAELHVALANAYYTMQDLVHACEHFKKVLDAVPEAVEIWLRYGIALEKQGLLDQATRAFETSVELDRDFTDAHLRLANQYLMQNRLAEAVQEFDQCIRCAAAEKLPNHAQTMAAVYYGKGIACSNRKDTEAATACYRSAIELNPDFALAHFALSCELLRCGNYVEGWKEFDWHLSDKEFFKPVPGYPQWDGRVAKSKTILIIAEQGFGDMIHFSRFVKMVRERVGRVLFLVPHDIAGLMATLAGPDNVITEDPRLFGFDEQITLTRLPRLFEVDICNPPASIPYLAADPVLVERMRAKMSGRRGLRVGLVWAGNPKFVVDQHRSIPPADLAALKYLPVGQWYAMQTKTDLPPELMWDNMMNLGQDMTDFSITAAIMKNLDLMITVDTSSAHLAGALGIPVWTIMRYCADWRWLMDRSDSPWYPTMRLFRPGRVRQWDDVIGQIADGLTHLARVRQGDTHGGLI